MTPEQEIQAIARLGLMRDRHADLVRAEAKARLALASAIMRMDEADDTPGRHSLNEQWAVEAATVDYANALADLIRGGD